MSTAPKSVPVTACQLRKYLLTSACSTNAFIYTFAFCKEDQIHYLIFIDKETEVSNFA